MTSGSCFVITINCKSTAGLQYAENSLVSFPLVYLR